MKKVKIITDSCSDLNTEIMERYDIDYVRMVTIEDGEEAPALLSWSREEAKRLYDTIRGGKRITTSQVPVEEFMNAFDKYLKEGYDIVYIGCSSRQSGSVNTACVISEEFTEKYPDSKIYCVDSQNASLGEGMLAVEAAKLAKEGRSAEEIHEHILSIRKTVNQYVTVHTLEHLRKAGRVTASSAFFGNLMGVKPILISDAEGTQTAIKKVRGRQNSLNELIEMLKKNIVDSEEQTIYIAHADCDDTEMSQFVAKVKEEIPCKEVYVGVIGPIIGASIGPDAIGIWGFGNKVTHKAE
ncbi:MAG: DegV family protein [Ruminococcaceae bacterium]|nr:DegV family protein [Oscillospiraceae bacterium]